MRQMTFAQAIEDALAYAMAKDNRIFILGKTFTCCGSIYMPDSGENAFDRPRSAKARFSALL